VLRQLLADGALGEVRTVLADHGQHFTPDAAHRLFDPDLAGGALLDLGIYPVSFASFVLGAPERVTAVGQQAFTGVDAQVSAVLESAGAHAVVNTSLLERTPTTASISGSLGIAELSRPFYAPGPMTVTMNDGTVLTHDGGPVPGHEGLAYQAAHLAALVAEAARESPLLPLDETVRVLATVDEIRRQVGVSFPGE
jgi:predicted dehydrogenase